MLTEEYLSLIVDGICLLILILCFSSGWKNGLASNLVRTLSVLIAVVVTFFVYSYVASFLVDMGLEETIVDHLRVETSDIDAMQLPSVIKQQLSQNNTEEIYSLLGVTSLVGYVKHYIARILINALSILLVFMVSLVLLALISKNLRLINKIPVVGLVNELLGAACAVVVGWISITFVLFLLNALGARIPELEPILDAIDHSYVTVLMQKVNLFNSWVLRVL